MLSDDEQRQLATRMGKLLADRDLSVVFVGSTAIVGLRLFSRTSKDADALAPSTFTMQEARDLFAEIAEEEGVDVDEPGWGTIALVNRDRDGNILWRVDLLVPEKGIIPEQAAELIHELAVETEIGKTACIEHVLAMKAVAHGDCLGKGQEQRREEYESDLRQLRDRIGEKFDWVRVEALLARFTAKRREMAAEKIHELFGRDVGLPQDDDISVM